MRTQYCRIKIVEGDAGEKCNVSPDTISDLKKVLKFVEDHPDLSGLATSAIVPLMAIPDPQERENATLTVSKALKSKKNPATGKFTKRVTKKDVLKTMEKEAPSATPPTPPTPPKPKNNAGNYQPGDLIESGLPPQQPLSVVMKEKEPEFFNLSEPAATVDPAKLKREQMEKLAEELLSHYSPTIQTMVTEIMREHPSYKVKDVFYFGVQALAEKKKP